MTIWPVATNSASNYANGVVRPVGIAPKQFGFIHFLLTIVSSLETRRNMKQTLIANILLSSILWLKFFSVDEATFRVDWMHSNLDVMRSWNDIEFGGLLFQSFGCPFYHKPIYNLNSRCDHIDFAYKWPGRRGKEGRCKLQNWYLPHWIDDAHRYTLYV